MIDLHAHIFFDELLGQAGEFGPEIRQTSPGRNEVVTGAYSWPIGENTSLGFSAASRLEALDAAGIDIQALSLSPLWLFHSATSDVAVPFLRRANDLLHEWTSHAPDRLLAYAALPTQDVDLAVEELERNVARGFIGGYIGSNARPALDDPDLDPLYAAHARLGVPLYIHSTVPGVDGPAGDPRLDRWLGHVTVGYPNEETLTVLSMILGGVLDRHPGLNVVIPHGGGTFPFIAGRVLDSLRLPTAPVSRDTARAALKRLWFDTHVHSRDSLDLLISVVDTGRLVFGSNYGGWDSGHTNEVSGMEPLLDANARRLLRLDQQEARNEGIVEVGHGGR